MTMHKGMRLLLASTMTVVGLAVGSTPAHATESQASVGTVWRSPNFSGESFSLLAPSPSCNIIGDPGTIHVAVRSARIHIPFGTLTLYRDAEGIFTLRCVDPVAILPAGTQDSGLGTELGEKGAKYYSYSD